MARALRNAFWHSVAHLRADWRAVLFVPALITIFHHFALIEAIDGYAYLVIGNLSAFVKLPGLAGSALETHSGAVVAVIDEQTYEAKYGDRSPFNRCVLHNDLLAIYKAGPDRLVIDLDLSPALWLEETATTGEWQEWQTPKCDATARLEPVTVSFDRQAERMCEERLYCLVRTYARKHTPAKGDKSPPENVHKVDTTIMSPSDSSRLDVTGRQLCWQSWMQKAGVRFGRPELPVTFGLVIKQFDHERSLARVANATEDQLPVGCPPEQGEEVRYPAGQPLSAGHHKLTLIDPRRYTAGVTEVSLLGRTDAQGPAELTTVLSNELEQMKKGSKEWQKIVFVGAGFGEQDTYLTPVDEVYGVEVHAAAYLTHFAPLTQFDTPAAKVLQFLLDVVMAALFSLTFAVFWSRYFAYRLSAEPSRRERAPVYVAGLVLVCAVFAFFLCLGALILLQRFGTWLSPVPIALGMFIDSFVVGSVHEAVRSAGEKRHDHANLSPGDERASGHASKGEPHPDGGDLKPANASEFLGRSVFGEQWLAYYRQKENAAYAFVALWRLSWLVVVLCGIVMLFLH